MKSALYSFVKLCILGPSESPNLKSMQKQRVREGIMKVPVKVVLRTTPVTENKYQPSYIMMLMSIL